MHIRYLPDVMDDFYGPGNWTQRQGVGVGTDISPAINACFQGFRTLSGGRGRLIITPGVWMMQTAVGANLLSGNQIEGLGSTASIVVYNKPGGVAFHFNGNFGFTGGGIKGLGIQLESNQGQSLATAVMLQGGAINQPDQTNFEDLYITSLGATSYWWNAFHADGTARTFPQGIRVCNMTNIQTFNCRNLNFYLANVVQWTGTNLGCFTGIGGIPNSFWLTGGAAQNTWSSYVTMTRVTAININVFNVTPSTVIVNNVQY